MRHGARHALELFALILLTLAIAALDRVAGGDISLWILYLIPISLAAGLAGLTVGLVFSMLAAMAIFLVGSELGVSFPTLGHRLFAIGSYLAAYALFALLVSIIRVLLLDQDALRLFAFASIDSRLDSSRKVGRQGY
jgi:hypothetical protein